MRHLIVPSVETQHWVDLCTKEKWLVNGSGVISLGDGLKGIPLNDDAPNEEDGVWQNNQHVDVEGTPTKPKHWTELLDGDLYLQFEELWPKSYEIVGDVLIVRIEPEVSKHQNEIAQAMLDMMPNVRIICADFGVEGEYRVRKLDPILSRDGQMTTRTRVKENGLQIWTNPSTVYYSARLSTERINNLAALKKLRQKLSRAIILADPYAGVGPALGNLITEEGLCSEVHAGDLNPAAFELLQSNMEYFSTKANNSTKIFTYLDDGRKWQIDQTRKGIFDALLVNIPHSSVEHLPSLMPLMKRDSITLIRGWAIIDRFQQNEVDGQIIKTIESAGGKISHFHSKEIKGFSSSKIFIVFESEQKFQ